SASWKSAWRPRAHRGRRGGYRNGRRNNARLLIRPIRLIRPIPPNAMGPGTAFAIPGTGGGLDQTNGAARLSSRRILATARTGCGASASPRGTRAGVDSGFHRDVDPFRLHLRFLRHGNRHHAVMARRRDLLRFNAPWQRHGPIEPAHEPLLANFT